LAEINAVGFGSEDVLLRHSKSLVSVSWCHTRGQDHTTEVTQQETATRASLPFDEAHSGGAAPAFIVTVFLLLQTAGDLMQQWESR